MDIYENIVVGNFLFGLGANIGMRHRESLTPPMFINLLQQTPLDRPLGDVLLENSQAARLIEFKRKANDSVKETNKLNVIRAMLNSPKHRFLTSVSKSIHWYIETEQVDTEFKTRIVPYLELDNQLISKVSFEDFIEATVEELISGSSVRVQQCTEYIKMLQTAPGSTSASSGGLIVVLTTDNKIRYAAIAEFRDFRLTIKQIQERMNVHEVQRIKESEQEMLQTIGSSRSRSRD